MINKFVKYTECDRYSEPNRFTKHKKKSTWSYRVIIISGCTTEERIHDDYAKAEEEYFSWLSGLRINYVKCLIHDFYICIERYVGKDRYGKEVTESLLTQCTKHYLPQLTDMKYGDKNYER